LRFRVFQLVGSAASDPLLETTLISLALALFLILSGLGSVLTGPLSEVMERNPVYIVCLTLFILLDSGAALAQNVVQRILCRGLAGLFASGPLVCSGAALVDLWSLVERVYVFPYYAMIIELGATVGPVPGSYIVMATAVSWRFVDWATIILAGALLTLVVLFLPETYSPVLLRWKAQQLRRLTGDDRYRAPLEFKKVCLPRRLRNAFNRPILIFWTEPIIVIFAGYMATVFIILYTFTAGFTSIFEDTYKLNKGVTGLCFLAISTGIVLASCLAPVTMKLVRRDTYHARRHNLPRPEPECNLYMFMFGAPAIPI
jgi:MFS family permease